MSEEVPDKLNLPGIDESKASDESIVREHARLRRQHVAGSPIAFFSSMALILVVVFAWFYLRRHMAGYDAQMYLSERGAIHAFNTWEPAGAGVVKSPYELGQELFTARCASCHMANGEGMAGNFPPLAGSEWVLHEESSLPIKVVLAGLGGPITVKGQPYNGNMVSMVADLDDQSVANIVTYIRQSWGNEASEVTADQVAAVKDEIGSRGPWTGPELQSYFE